LASSTSYTATGWNRAATTVSRPSRWKTSEGHV
jgi:hypothetical protein